MRGATTLFRDIFEEPTEAKLPTGLRQQKINCMIDYYYFMGRKTGKSYANLLEILSQSFFLSSITLSDILQDNHDKLTAVRNAWKDKPLEELQAAMQANWPMFVW